MGRYAVSVAEAMRRAPRGDYLPPGQRARAAEDVPLQLGHRATSSQPSTVATMLELLDARPGDRVLVSAMAPSMPEPLVEQLADDGRLVVPVRGRMVVVDRVGDEVRTREAPGWYRFVPLQV